MTKPRRVHPLAIVIAFLLLIAMVFSVLSTNVVVLAESDNLVERNLLLNGDIHLFLLKFPRMPIPYILLLR